MPLLLALIERRLCVPSSKDTSYLFYYCDSTISVTNAHTHEHTPKIATYLNSSGNSKKTSVNAQFDICFNLSFISWTKTRFWCLFIILSVFFNLFLAFASISLVCPSCINLDQIVCWSCRNTYQIITSQWKNIAQATIYQSIKSIRYTFLQYQIVFCSFLEASSYIIRI